ncbi:MAG: hypothetical protein QOC96_2118 [Acidobacteriota bacterium]|nr:hypothetical protein [Acidobacteriota bacterium]
MSRICFYPTGRVCFYGVLFNCEFNRVLVIKGNLLKASNIDLTASHNISISGR